MVEEQYLGDITRSLPLALSLNRTCALQQYVAMI